MKPCLTALERMEQSKIKPNFFCSAPYFHYNNAVTHIQAGMVWVEADDVCLFPPLPVDAVDHPPTMYPVKEIWSDFQGFKPPDGQWVKEFLDWEYLFNPHDFKMMNGGKWQTFRKNSRKWPKSQRNTHYGTITQGKEERWNLLCLWLLKRQDTVLDAEVITEYVMNPVDGVYQKGLTRDGQLVGINVWDDNYCYINFRFCIADGRERYLDEYMRYLFYTDPEIANQGKLINDGGALDSVGLERFKDKMNPVCKRPVYGWKNLKK